MRRANTIKHFYCHLVGDYYRMTDYIRVIIKRDDGIFFKPNGYLNLNVMLGMTHIMNEWKKKKSMKIFNYLNFVHTFEDN